MSDETINPLKDPLIGMATLRERQNNSQKEIDVINDAIFGNGKSGIKEDVSAIKRDIHEINDKFYGQEKKREENQLSKKDKTQAMVAVVLVLLGAWVPNIFSMFN